MVNITDWQIRSLNSNTLKTVKAIFFVTIVKQLKNVNFNHNNFLANENCCDEIIPTPKPIVRCEYCSQTPCIGQNCFRNCRLCGSKFAKNYEEAHRCIVYYDTPAKEFRHTGENTNKEKLFKLWSYDIEARAKIVEGTVTAFERENNNFTNYQVFEKQMELQEANLVVFQNVFNLEETFTYFGPTSLRDFITFMVTHNRGYNICVAHNASGYDARLVVEEVSRMNLPTKSTNSGLKFTELIINQTIFRDSLLHLQGSLAGLAKNFNLPLMKGNFPHLFNTEENYYYEGEIPELKYFDLTYTAKSQNDIDSFMEWYNQRKQLPWNFKQELISYCQDDVKILALIMKLFHEICSSKFELSPWNFSTGPSYCHTVIKKQLSDQLNLPVDKSHRNFAVQQLALNQYWAVLCPQEYWFARSALIGGRTDVRRVYYEPTPEELESGKRIMYQDIVSMYPYVQACPGLDYPVGIPKINVYDEKYYPCTKHQSPGKDNNWTPCDCSRSSKIADRKIIVNEHSEQPTMDYLMSEEFFGIACVTINPPKNLFHPVLVVWDKTSFKRVATLENIVEGTFTSVEIQVALNKGYKLIKVHRIDQYTRKPGLWVNFVKDLYIQKMANSEPTPSSAEEQTRLINEYETKFEMGRQVEESFSNWDFRPALRMTYKIMLNSGWGKHCQRPNLPFLSYIDDTDYNSMKKLFTNIEHGDIRLMDVCVQGNRVVYKSMPKNHNYVPHDLYLPAGLFVPAYGRILLYDALDMLQDRVLYHDTDSVIYIYDPTKENLPTSDIWGSWDEEKVSKNGNITAFIGLGPKSYALKTADGKDVIKVKGLSLKHSHRNLINFESLKDMVLNPKSIDVPQRNFVYKMGQGIHINESLKTLTFDPLALKGYLHTDYKVYPPGYCKGCLNLEETHSCE